MGAWMQPSLALIIIVVGAALAFAGPFPHLHALWTDPFGAFSHGYLVAVLSLWMCVHHWRKAPPARLTPWRAAALPLAGMVVLLIVMDAMFINSARLVLLPFILIAAIACAFGREAAARLALPILYLLFALPQWWPLNEVLQTVTSKVVGTLITVTDLSAYMEGNFIHLPAGIIEIATGCSGLNFLVAGAALAGFYAFMYLERWRNRLIVLAAAAVIACIVNWIRVFVLVAVGVYTDMQHYLIQVDHLYFGWVLFMVFMVPVLMLARRLDEGEAQGATRARVSAATPIAVTGGVLPMALVAGCLLALPAFVAIESGGKQARAPELPDRVGSWSLSTSGPLGWQPAFANATEERLTYMRDGETVEVYRAWYPHQTSEARVTRSDNDIFGRGWRLADRTRVASAHEVVESRGYVNERERLVWSWYVVAGEPATTRLAAKLHELRGLLQRRRDAGAVAISTECIPDCAAGRDRLRDFMQQFAASPR